MNGIRYFLFIGLCVCQVHCNAILTQHESLSPDELSLLTHEDQRPRARYISALPWYVNGQWQQLMARRYFRTQAEEQARAQPEESGAELNPTSTGSDETGSSGLESEENETSPKITADKKETEKPVTVVSETSDEKTAEAESTNKSDEKTTKTESADKDQSQKSVNPKCNDPKIEDYNSHCEVLIRVKTCEKLWMKLNCEKSCLNCV